MCVCMCGCVYVCMCTCVCIYVCVYECVYVYDSLCYRHTLSLSKQSQLGAEDRQTNREGDKGMEGSEGDVNRRLWPINELLSPCPFLRDTDLQ